MKYVVLDDIHLIDGTYRGDQLRTLLTRLRKLASPDGYYILSATLSNPHEVASRYVSDFEVIEHREPREIIYQVIDISNLESGLIRLLEDLSFKKTKKVIFFCNSRSNTETIANTLRKFRPAQSVGVHHANLSRKIRVEVEKAMRWQNFFFCVATSTLEIGIDIGDIDAVVLVHPPIGVSSLLQRIGRGNRRKGYTLSYGLYANKAEKSIFDEMYQLAKQGRLEREEYTPDVSVTIQQILSILFEKRYKRISPEEITESSKCLGVSQEDVNLILSQPPTKEYVEALRQRFYPSQKLMDLAEKGFIHSNIQGRQEYRVIEEMKRRVIGRISKGPMSRNASFILSGKVWQVVRTEADKLYVEKAKGETSLPYFAGRGSRGKFFSWLPKNLRNH